MQQAVDSLMKKYLVSDKSAGYGGRVTKYKHRFCNTEFGSLKFSKQEVGILCVLLLRGPQTPGELRARTNRLCDFADANEVETALKNLMSRDGWTVHRPAGQSRGRPRIALRAFIFRRHRIDAGTCCRELSEPQPARAASAAGSGLGLRVAALEELVAQLRADLDALKR